MKEENTKVWLYVDKAYRNLMYIRHWTTSADEWNEDLKLAIKHLESALKKLKEDK